MSDWYFNADDKTTGPVSEQVLLAYLSDHRNDDVFVWQTGLDGWKSYRSISSLIGKLAPPLQPQIQFDVVDSQPEQTRAPKVSRVRRWLKKGALVGLGLGVIGAFGKLSARDESNTTHLIGYLIGHFGASAALGAVFGVLFAIIADFLDKPVANPENRKRTFNIFKNHWYGLYPLWVSYWVFSIVVYLLVVLFGLVLKATFDLDKGFNPISIFSGVLCLWLFVLVVGIWQSTGVWRSAGHYASRRHAIGKKAFWGGMAKAAVILGFINLIGAFFNQALPQLRESYRIAFLNDPDIPDYSMRVMRNGTEAEIVGGLKFGVADDFTKILNASRQVKVVHLDSIGGRLGEGEKLFRLFRERNLDTYVASRCLSACTLAFAGGRQRYLLRGAVLGFHRGTFAGVEEATFDNQQSKIFHEAGFSPSFIQTAATTPNKEMWRPSADILLGAKVITATVDASKFAFSGVGTDFTKEKAAEAFASASPLYVALKQRYPAQFDALAESYYQGILKGNTQSETIVAIRSQLSPFILSLIAQADDDVVVDYSRLLTDQYRALRLKDVSLCYVFASGDGSIDPSEMPKDLLLRETNLQERVVRTAKRREPVDQAALQDIAAQITKTLQLKGMSAQDFKLLETTKLPKAQHARYCELTISFFQEVILLPASSAATFVRSVFSAK